MARYYRAGNLCCSITFKGGSGGEPLLAFVVLRAPATAATTLASPVSAWSPWKNAARRATCYYLYVLFSSWRRVTSRSDCSALLTL